jgi:hypothetical protein
MQTPPLDPVVLALLRTKPAQDALKRPADPGTQPARLPEWLGAPQQPQPSTQQPTPQQQPPASEYSIVQGGQPTASTPTNPFRSASEILREQSDFLRSQAAQQQDEAAQKRKQAEETKQKSEQIRQEALGRKSPQPRKGFGTPDMMKMLLLALFAGLSGGEEAGAFVTSMVRSYMDQVKAYNEANQAKFEKDKQAALDEADRLSKESAKLEELADLLEGRSDKTLFQWLDTQEKAAATATQEQKNAQLEKKQEQSQRAQLDQYNLTFLKSIYDPNQTEADFQDRVDRYNAWVGETNAALGETRYQPIDPNRAASIWSQTRDKRAKQEQYKLGELYIKEGSRQLSSGTTENRQVGAQMFLQGVFLQSSSMPDGPEKEQFLSNIHDTVQAAAGALPPQSVLAMVKARILQRSENDLVRREYWKTEAVIEQVRKLRSGGGGSGGKRAGASGKAGEQRALGNLILEYKRLTGMEGGGIFGPQLGAEDRAMVAAMKAAVRRQAAELGIDLDKAAAGEKQSAAQQKQPPKQPIRQRSTKPVVPTINGKPAFIPDTANKGKPPAKNQTPSPPAKGQNARPQRSGDARRADNPFNLLPPVNTNW